MDNQETHTYTEAFDELQQIVDEIERGEIRIDELSEKVKRAKALIGVCRSKLVDTEADVAKLLSNLSADADANADPTADQ